MSELISGKEALIALANGEEVQLQALGDMNWYDSTQWTVGELLCFKGKFRLKPITISVNGKSIAKPYLASRDGKKIEIEFYSETNAHDFMEALRNAT